MPNPIRTSPRPEREVSGPVIGFTIADEIEKLKREPEWPASDRNAVTVVKTANLSVVLTVIKRGASLCGHEVDGPVTLQVLSGQVRFTAAGEPRTLRAGMVIALEKSVPHEIEAVEDSELLLTIARDVQ